MPFNKKKEVACRTTKEISKPKGRGRDARSSWCELRWTYEKEGLEASVMLIRGKK